MKWYYIVAIVVGILVLLGLLILVVFNGKKKDTNEDYQELLLALGGKENISEVSFKGSRVNVLLIDKTLIDKEKLKTQGVETIVMSNKKMTMVVGKQSEIIFNYLDKQISK